MNRLLLLTLALYCSGTCFGQDVSTVLTNVFAAQARLTTVSYQLERVDTFVSGATRRINGQAMLRRLPSDSIFGFSFRAKQDNVDAGTVYDGKTAFYLDHQARTYSLVTDRGMIPHMLGRPGGQVILQCLYRLDTTRATGLSLTEDATNYYLRKTLPDIKEYDIVHRWHVYRIDKKTWLPLGVREHQETDGHVQDLNYQIHSISLGETPMDWSQGEEIIPAGYTAEADRDNKKLKALRLRSLPSFALPLFDSSGVVTSDFKGKVVLLDFWEVWCGPCIASMPKVQALYEKYERSGLQVYGIMSERDQLDPAKKLVEKRGVRFPNLVSNPEVNERFGVAAVPTYILIDRKGIVQFISEGYSDVLDKLIASLLAEKG